MLVVEIDEKKALKEAEELSKGFIVPLVDNDLECQEAVNLVKTARSTKKVIDDKMRNITRPLDKAKKETRALFVPLLNEIDKFIASTGSAIMDYQRIQEAKRREAERKARALAEKEAENLRKRAEKVKTESKREEFLKRAEETEAVQVVVPKTKIIGTHSRTTWHARVIDFAALPDTYKLANETMLRKVAVATKGQMKIAGVGFYSIENQIT